MAYNNYFPATYQPMYYPTQANAFPTQMNVGSTQPTQSGIIWVQGEAGAKSYLVAPNTTVALWDSETQVIYLKSADVSGMPSMKVIDYTVRDMLPAKQTAGVSYVTKDEFEKLRAEVQKMMEGKKNESTLSADE